MKDPSGKGQQVVKKQFNLRKYYNTTSSSASLYYSHIFLQLHHEKQAIISYGGTFDILLPKGNE